MTEASEIRTIPIRDPVTGTVAFKRWQDCEDIVDRNKRLQNEPQKRAGSLRMIADIPCVIIEKWLSEEMDWHGPNARAAYKELMSPYGIKRIIMKKLRDPDWAWLRATDGKF
jgi:hypothetical protein